MKDFELVRAIINVPSIKATRKCGWRHRLCAHVAVRRRHRPRFAARWMSWRRRRCARWCWICAAIPAVCWRLRGECRKVSRRGDLIVFTRGRDLRLSAPIAPALAADFPGCADGGAHQRLQRQRLELSPARCRITARRAMGEKSLGKGSVQSVLPQDGGTAIWLTTAKYYTPSERVIHDAGIEPDVVARCPPKTGATFWWPATRPEEQTARKTPTRTTRAGRREGAAARRQRPAEAELLEDGDVSDLTIGARLRHACAVFWCIRSADGVPVARVLGP